MAEDKKQVIENARNHLIKLDVKNLKILLDDNDWLKSEKISDKGKDYSLMGILINEHLLGSSKTSLDNNEDKSAIVELLFDKKIEITINDLKAIDFTNDSPSNKLLLTKVIQQDSGKFLEVFSEKILIDSRQTTKVSKKEFNQRFALIRSVFSESEVKKFDDMLNKIYKDIPPLAKNEEKQSFLEIAKSLIFKFLVTCLDKFIEIKFGERGVISDIDVADMIAKDIGELKFQETKETVQSVSEVTKNIIDKIKSNKKENTESKKVDDKKDKKENTIEKNNTIKSTSKESKILYSQDIILDNEFHPKLKFFIEQGNIAALKDALSVKVTRAVNVSDDSGLSLIGQCLKTYLPKDGKELNEEQTKKGIEVLKALFESRVLITDNDLNLITNDKNTKFEEEVKIQLLNQNPELFTKYFKSQTEQIQTLLDQRNEPVNSKTPIEIIENKEFNPEIEFFIETTNHQDLKRWIAANSEESLKSQNAEGLTLIGLFIKLHLPEQDRKLTDEQMANSLQTLEVLLDKNIRMSDADLELLTAHELGPLGKEIAINGIDLNNDSPDNVKLLENIIKDDKGDFLKLYTDKIVADIGDSSKISQEEFMQKFDLIRNTMNADQVKVFDKSLKTLYEGMVSPNSKGDNVDRNEKIRALIFKVVMFALEKFIEIKFGHLMILANVIGGSAGINISSVAESALKDLKYTEAKDMIKTISEKAKNITDKIQNKINSTKQNKKEESSKKEESVDSLKKDSQKLYSQSLILDNEFHPKLKFFIEKGNIEALKNTLSFRTNKAISVQDKSGLSLIGLCLKTYLPGKNNELTEVEQKQAINVLKTLFELKVLMNGKDLDLITKDDKNNPLLEEMKIQLLEQNPKLFQQYFRTQTDRIQNLLDAKEESMKSKTTVDIVENKEFNPEVEFLVETTDPKQLKNWIAVNSEESLNSRNSEGLTLIGLFIKLHLPEQDRKLNDQQLANSFETLKVLFDQNIKMSEADLKLIPIDNLGPLGKEIIKQAIKQNQETLKIRIKDNIDLIDKLNHDFVNQMRNLKNIIDNLELKNFEKNIQLGIKECTLAVDEADLIKKINSLKEISDNHQFNTLNDAIDKIKENREQYSKIANDFKQDNKVIMNILNKIHPGKIDSYLIKVQENHEKIFNIKSNQEKFESLIREAEKCKPTEIQNQLNDIVNNDKPFSNRKEFSDKLINLKEQFKSSKISDFVRQVEKISVGVVKASDSVKEKISIKTDKIINDLNETNFHSENENAKSNSFANLKNLISKVTSTDDQVSQATPKGKNGDSGRNL